ncbi:MAG: beta-lactamase family protein [Ignavibacteria bacterium]|nr:beta-lactamase family protein [Ignavibacteria bacterium]
MNTLIFVLLLYLSFSLSEKISAFDNDRLWNNIISKSDPLELLLNSKVEQTFMDLEIPGAIVGVWKGDSDNYIKTFGVSDIVTNTPINTDDHMRIGSITKTFTGTVLLQLYDENKINLTDKLSKYFPDFPNGENITIDMLGSMTSGIYNYSENENFQNTLMNNLDTTFTPDELIDIAKAHTPYFPPGEGFHYSNSNTVLLGLIIEKITGNSLTSEIQNRIFTPLGMINSLFATDTYFPDPKSQGYIYMDSLQLTPTDVTNQDPTWAWAAGAVISTLADVHKYAKKLATGELISKKAQDERLKWGKTFIPETGAWKGEKLNYGFAIADFNGAIGHNGGIPGYNSFMGYLPEQDVTIIVLCNMQDNKAGVGPADYIARMIVEIILKN